MVLSRLPRKHALLRIGLGMGLAFLLVLSVLAEVHPVFASGGGCNCDTFVQRATTTNSSRNFTFLNDPLANNNPNAVIFVTPNWNPNGVYTGIDNHQVGVWYDTHLLRGNGGAWTIFNEDGSPMPIGVSFNVEVLPGTDINTYVQTATDANTSGYIMYINNPNLNGLPQAPLLVTQNANPGGTGGILGGGIANNHAIGVWYDSAVGEWTIYNEDRSPIPNGASFNVSFADGFQVATVSNTSGDSTCITFFSSISPSAVVFVTHEYSGYFTDVAAVWYNQSLGEWCVFDGSYNMMPIGATFSFHVW